MTWIYVLGATDGSALKIGLTRSASIRPRREGVERAQMRDERYVLLVGVRGPAYAEKAIHEYFARFRLDRGSHLEYYQPATELIEWVLWLRQQWYAVFDEDESASEAYEEHPTNWLPEATRREPRPLPDPSRLLQDEQATGPLAGTAWAWMPDLTATFQDYFTPPDLVARAAEAMGGIDLDAASHWIAQRRLHKAGVLITDYFHTNKSAFTHEWTERVWLNPPYGEYGPWFNRAASMLDAGLTRQLCMLSPMWAFITKIAQPMVSRASAMIVLTPTPRFFNPGNPTRTGSNQPHAIVYWGSRAEMFLRSFDGVGIPVRIQWEEIRHPLDIELGAA